MLTSSKGQTSGRRSSGTPFHASLRSCAGSLGHKVMLHVQQTDDAPISTSSWSMQFTNLLRLFTRMECSRASFSDTPGGGASSSALAFPRWMMWRGSARRMRISTRTRSVVAHRSRSPAHRPGARPGRSAGASLLQPYCRPHPRPLQAPPRPCPRRVRRIRRQGDLRCQFREAERMSRGCRRCHARWTSGRSSSRSLRDLAGHPWVGRN